MCHSVPVDVLRSVMVDDPARPRVLLKVVHMRYTNLKMPPWKIGVLKAIQDIPVSQIRDGLILAFILIGLIALVVAPI